MTYLKFIIFIYLCRTIETYTFVDKGKSYIHYKQWNASGNGILSFKFKTFEKWGLLVYSDNSNSSKKWNIRNSLLIKLRGARLHVTVQMGFEDYRSRKFIELGRNLDDLQWHYVKMWRNYKETKVQLDNETRFIFNDGGHDSLRLNTGLYIGGLSDNISKSNHLVDRGVLVLSRFSGCLDDFTFSHSHEPGKFINPPLLEMVEVKPGCLNACVNVTCENNGQCRNRFTTFYCDCKGTGYEGDRCTKEANSINFDQNSYISINVPNKHKTSSQTIVEFRFRTTTGDGVIFAVNNRYDHFLIELQNNMIRMSWDLGGGYHISSISDRVFNDGVWHLVQVFRYGRDTSIIVDKKYCVNSSTPGVFTKLDIRGSLLYIGGHPSKTVLSSINSESRRNFTGCLQQTYFNGIDVIYKVLQVKSDRFKKYGRIEKGCNVKKALYLTYPTFPPLTARSMTSRNPPPTTKYRSMTSHHPPPTTKYRSITSHHPPTTKYRSMTSHHPLPIYHTVLPPTAKCSSTPASHFPFFGIGIGCGIGIGLVLVIIAITMRVVIVRYRYRPVLLSYSLKSRPDF